MNLKNPTSTLKIPREKHQLLKLVANFLNISVEQATVNAVDAYFIANKQIVKSEIDRIGVGQEEDASA